MLSEEYRGLYGHSATAVGNYVVVIGGKSAPFRINRQVFALDIVTKSWSTLECSGADPLPRAFHTAALFGWKLYVFGGLLGVGIDDVHYNSYNAFVHPDCLDRGVLQRNGKDRLKEPAHLRRVTQSRLEAQSLYMLDLEEGATWSAVTTYGNVPPTRANHCSAIYRDSLLVTGGYSVHTSGNVQDEESRVTSCVYMLNLLTNTWKVVETSMSPPVTRFGFSGITTANFWVQFGGTDVGQQRESSATYVMDMESLRWKPVTSVPCPARSLHTAVKFGDAMYIFGGASNVSSQLFGDVYTLDLLTGFWTLFATSGEQPPPIFGHTATVVGTCMLVLGGMTADFEYNKDLWMLDFQRAEWTRHSCGTALMALDNVRGVQYERVATRSGARLNSSSTNAVSSAAQTQSYSEPDSAFALSHQARVEDAASAARASRSRLESLFNSGIRTPTTLSQTSGRDGGGAHRDVQVTDGPIHREVAARVQRIKDLIQVNGNGSASDQVALYWQKELDSLAVDNQSWRNAGVKVPTGFASESTIMGGSSMIPPTLSLSTPTSDMFSPLKMPLSRAGYVSPSIVKLGLQDYLSHKKPAAK